MATHIPKTIKYYEPGFKHLMRKTKFRCYLFTYSIIFQI